MPGLHEPLLQFPLCRARSVLTSSVGADLLGRCRPPSNHRVTFFGSSEELPSDPPSNQQPPNQPTTNHFVPRVPVSLCSRVSPSKAKYMTALLEPPRIIRKNRSAKIVPPSPTSPDRKELRSLIILCASCTPYPANFGTGELFPPTGLSFCSEATQGGAHFVPGVPARAVPGVPEMVPDVPV